VLYEKNAREKGLSPEITKLMTAWWRGIHSSLEMGHDPAGRHAGRGLFFFFSSFT
jgi:hypothetical protein